MLRLKNIWLVFCLTRLLDAQDLSQDKERYRLYKPSQIIEIENRLRENPDELISELKNKLDEFYSSDPSRRKIQARKKNNYGLYNAEVNQVKEYNTNLRRLLVRDITNQAAKSSFVKDAPSIYLLHKYMGENLLKQLVAQPYQAAFHYRQALKYRKLRLTPENFTHPDRLELLDENSPQIRLANDYSTAKGLVNKITKELKTARENRILQSDSFSYWRSQDKKGKLQSNREIPEIQNKLKQAESNFQSLENEYKDFKDKWDSESSKMLEDFANLVKQIESSFKKRQKVLNRAAVSKSSFTEAVSYDYSETRNFAAYANIMETAHKLDTKNPMISLALAKEYKDSQDIQRAISFFEQTLKANQNPREGKALKQEELTQIYFSLGGLYYQSKQFLKAAENYETALPLKKEPGLFYQLGKLHQEKTGDYPRAISLLSEYLEELEKINPSDAFERTKWLQKRFFASNYILKSQKKLREFSLMKSAIKTSQELFGEIKDMVDQQQKKVNESFKALQELKKPILDQTSQAELNRFYLAENEYTSNKLLLGQLRTIKNSLPLKSMYFDLAEYLQSQNDIEGAIETYEQAEREGVFPKEARRKLAKLYSKYR